MLILVLSFLLSKTQKPSRRASTLVSYHIYQVYLYFQAAGLSQNLYMILVIVGLKFNQIYSKIICITRQCSRVQTIEADLDC